MRELEAALAHAIKPLDASMRAGVEGLIAHARARVGVVELRVAPAEARVYVDDASEDAGHRLVLEPGSHALRVVAPGFVEQRLGLELLGGASQTLRVSLVPVVLDTSPRAQLTPPMAPAPVRVDAPPSPGPTNRLRRASMFALLGLSGASAIAAGAVYWQGNQRVERLDEDCRTSQAMTCTPAQRDRRADELQLDRLAHTSTALVVVSGAAALLSASLLLWERVEKRRRVQVQASAGGVLRLTTSF